MPENIVEFKSTKQWSLLLNIFGNVVYGDTTEKQAVPNTAYINCNVVSLPEDIESKDIKQISIGINTVYNTPIKEIYQGNIVVYSKTQYLGTYFKEYNILYLVDIINPFDSVSLDILDQILRNLVSIKADQIDGLKNMLDVHQEVKLCIGDIVYDMIRREVHVSLIDRILNNYPESHIRTNGKTYLLEYGLQQSIGLYSYKEQLAEKMRNLIYQYKTYYYNEAQKMRQTYDKRTGDTLLMPVVSPEEARSNKLRLATIGKAIYYCFEVTVSVNSVISEESQKYKRLSKPVVFEKGELWIGVSAPGHVVDVKFRHSDRHPHVSAEGDVCLGSMSNKVSSTRIRGLNDVLKIKSQILNIMSTCNVSSAYHSDWYADQLDSVKPGSLNNIQFDSEE